MIKSAPSGSVLLDQLRIAVSDGKEVFRSTTKISDLSSGGGGSWADLSSETPTTASTYTVTWDETAYSEILIILDRIQPATDAVSFYLNLGSNNGGTIYNSTDDYDGLELIWEVSPSLSDLADTDKVRLCPAASNVANETISAHITIRNFIGSDGGASLVSELHYANSSGTLRTIEVKAMYYSNGTPGAAIDTAQFSFAAGNFANTGTVIVQGRLI